MQRTRTSFDLQSYMSRSTSGACFICQYLAGDPDYEHIEVARTDDAVVFLDRYPTLFGRVIVAPRAHLEGVTSDFSVESYLSLQRLVYHVAEAARNVLEPERIYILSLGSQAANAHVHWHVAPLPEGVPLEQQQFHALMHEHGTIQASHDEQLAYAQAIRSYLAEAS